MNREMDYTIASGLFTPPLDMILHNAGYVYVFQVKNAYENDKERLFSLPGIGKRRQQNIQYAIEELGRN